MKYLKSIIQKFREQLSQFKTLPESVQKSFLPFHLILLLFPLLCLILILMTGFTFRNLLIYSLVEILIFLFCYLKKIELTKSDILHLSASIEAPERSSGLPSFLKKSGKTLEIRCSSGELFTVVLHEEDRKKFHSGEKIEIYLKASELNRQENRIENYIALNPVEERDDMKKDLNSVHPE